MGDKQKSSAKKEKKAKRESTGGASDDVAPVKTEYLSPIAKPLADDKLQKKVRHMNASVPCNRQPVSNVGLCMQVLKLVKKAAKRKQVKRGVKEVIKAIRKKTKGCDVVTWRSLLQGHDSQHMYSYLFAAECVF